MGVLYQPGRSDRGRTGALLLAVIFLALTTLCRADALAPAATAAVAERAALSDQVDAARARGDGRAEAAALGEMALFSAREGHFADAEALFQQSRSAAEQAGAGNIAAQSAFNLAVVRSYVGRQEEPPTWAEQVGLRRGAARAATRPQAHGASLAYRDAAASAERAGSYNLQARALSAAAGLDGDASLLARAETALARAGEGRADGMLVAADAAIRVHDAGGAGALAIAGRLLGRAAADAQASGDTLQEGYARGLAARVAARAGNYDQALAMTRQAKFLTQSGGPAPAFLWGAQEAALLAGRGDVDAALAAYERAADEIRANRAALAEASPLAGQSSYRAAAEPILAAYAELLLQNARGDVAQARMVEARALMEQVRTLQLDQYFQDECITQLVRARVALEDLPANAAVIYPMLLGDRVELLVSSRGGAIQRFSSPAPRAAIEEDARALSQALRGDARGWLTDAWRAPSQRLYAALITPILPAIEGRDTLVFAPDGALRGVPMAALHDGSHFLIERFAIANALSLALVDPRPLEAAARRVLVAGISEARDGLQALPGVINEARDVRALTLGPCSWTANSPKPSSPTQLPGGVSLSLTSPPMQISALRRRRATSLRMIGACRWARSRRS